LVMADVTAVRSPVWGIRGKAGGGLGKDNTYPSSTCLPQARQISSNMGEEGEGEGWRAGEGCGREQGGVWTRWVSYISRK
jgi:hypothetical protein